MILMYAFDCLVLYSFFIMYFLGENVLRLKFNTSSCSTDTKWPRKQVTCIVECLEVHVQFKYLCMV